ncbi:hypothetical protein DTO027B9_605 [Paecilomyces variotii]|nr:hypothetical protein DTO027B9_605 [Paecilomyces variotii]
MASNFRFPETEQEWRDQIELHNLTNMTIHTLQNMKSASKATPEQFLLLRILYRHRRPIQFNPADWQLNIDLVTAQQYLASSVDFNAYIQNVHNNGGVALQGQQQGVHLGVFELPREAQRNIIDFSLSRGQAGSAPAGLPKADEAIVNLALVDFLQAVCLKMPGVCSRWVATRFRMRANFAQGGYTAVLDGGLTIRGEPEKIEAPLECKARSRADALPHVQLQEACQIAAWHMQAHCPATGDIGSPWMINNASDMQSLAEIILAFVLRVGDGK